MRFATFQDLALYHPQAGFYMAVGSPGRGGDFITSPEVGPLFGGVLAAALDRWWRDLRRPDPFFVIEVGAGEGTLAASILEAQPDCAAALRYVLVERSTFMRSEHPVKFPLVPIEELVANQAPLSGPLLSSTDVAPSGPFQGVILANELLDNLAIDLCEYRGHRWNYVCIGLSRMGELEEVLVPIREEEPIHKAAEHFGRGAEEGSRLALHGQAQDWLRASLDSLTDGRVVIFDYATDSEHMINTPSEEWLRTYRNHRPGAPPWDLPGSQDITCDVAIDQLAFVKSPIANHSQREFLEHFGLRRFVADAREVWHEWADVGDLAALRARARVQESRALVDETGLGAHRVVEWAVGNSEPPVT